MDSPIIFDPAVHSHFIHSLVTIHMACITTAPYTIATFLPPLTASRMQTWWEERVREVITGARVIIMQLAPNPSTGEEELAGYVSLMMPISETGPFRGLVEKLLVSPEHRRKGIARTLMMELEGIARKKGRTMLMLDTETGSPAELIYPKLGYSLVGIVPDYGFSPRDKSLKAGTFFFKNLATQSTK